MDSKIIDHTDQTFVQPPGLVGIFPKNIPVQIGVWIDEGEEVEWHYTTTLIGNVCTGYTIKDKK